MTVATRPFTPQLAGTCWTLDTSASTIEFSARQFWGLSTVGGRFSSSDGRLEFLSDGAGRAMLFVDAATVETGNCRRDRHLRARGYFDCERHPLVRFVADVAPAAAGGLGFAGGVSVDARSLGMMWSPFGKLSTPVRLAVRARLRRAG